MYSPGKANGLFKTVHSDSSAARILIVDDTPENLDVLGGILRGEYQVKVALNGPRALKIATSDAAPDLILLDVMMPEVDGHEVCRQLKASPKTQDIPIIFVTARTEVEDEAKGFELGAVDYITKPVSPAIVLARVRTHLALRRARRKMEDLSTKLARYLSPQIYQSIFEGRQDARIGGRRRKLTVFFSDIVQFTRQTEAMEPEDLAYILNSYLNRMSALVEQYGGTLDKFIGDAVLVFFGDPESRGEKEDALSCVRMALEMMRTLSELSEQWQTKGIAKEFEVRVGITTGFSTVGNFGSDERMTYTIIGNQVNLANRLQAAAKPGEILIAHETWLLVKDEIECIPQEPIYVKGFERPIQTYIVRGKIGATYQERHLEESCDGFSLSLDPAAVKPEQKAEIIGKLKAALDRLK